MQKLSKNFYLVLIILHLIITIPLAFNLNVWVDEASTLYNTQQGFIHTFQNVFHTEKQAPLYFLLLSLWRDIDDSFFFARLFSIICSCLAIKFFFDLAKSFFNQKQAILITTFFALHPFLIWISLEIRLYTMIVLLAVLLLKFFFEGYLNRRDAEERADNFCCFGYNFDLHQLLFGLSVSWRICFAVDFATLATSKNLFFPNVYSWVSNLAFSLGNQNPT